MAKRQTSEVIDYEAKAQEAREKRVKSCVEEINKVLEKYSCDVLAVVEVAGQLLPISSVLSFPAKVQIVTK